MPPAPEINILSPHLAFWNGYDPASKSQLFSTSVADDAGRMLIVDPIRLAAPARNELLRLGTVQAVAITNANHWRAAEQFSIEFNVPIFGRSSPTAATTMPLEPASRLNERFAGLGVIAIEGAAPGEIALHFPQEEGTLIVGDSLIHFDPYGLALLPKKYCDDEHEMRRSLRQLLGYRSKRLFFAHGLPIVNQVMSRLENLLQNE